MKMLSTLPEIKQIDYASSGFILHSLILITAAVIAAVVLSGYTAKRFDGNKTKIRKCMVLVGFFISSLLVCFYGCTPYALKGTVVALILLFASYQDMKTMECDDSIHLYIILAGFIGTDMKDLPIMVLAGLLIGGAVLLAGLYSRSGIGGADIKIVFACSFLTGIIGGLTGLLGGVVLALLDNLKKKKRKKKFPMIPYLSVGYMAVYLYQNLFNGGIC